MNAFVSPKMKSPYVDVHAWTRVIASRSDAYM